MGQPFPSKDVPANGFHGSHHAGAADDGRVGAVVKEKPAAGLQYWDGEDGPRDADGPPGDAAFTRLIHDNAEMRAQLEAAVKNEHAWAAQQQEYEGLLEEKSEVIRSLHQKVQELESRPTSAPLVPKEEELLSLSDELERERCQLQQERRQLEEEMMQLKEDEEALMKQMREMEVQMSRERAELARQRNELQRLNSDIRHELELATRDAALRERLAPLQRRHNEMMTRKGAAPQQEPGKPAAPQQAQQPQVEPPKDSGLLRRIFR